METADREFEKKISDDFMGKRKQPVMENRE